MLDPKKTGLINIPLISAEIYLLGKLDRPWSYSSIHKDQARFNINCPRVKTDRGADVAGVYTVGMMDAINERLVMFIGIC